jgi:hypothetical protein
MISKRPICNRTGEETGVFTARETSTLVARLDDFFCDMEAVSSAANVRRH